MTDIDILRAALAADYCERCTHHGSWHRLDGDQHEGPLDPGARFRCLGYDVRMPGPPVRTCDCPDMVRP